MEFEHDYRHNLRATSTRLIAKGLLAAGDTVSVRLAGAESFLLSLTNAAELLRSQISKLSLLEDELPFDSVAQLHRLLYRIRPDVGAIIINGQPWATALRQLPAPMPGVFDEQVRHLGNEVSWLGNLQASAAFRQIVSKGGNAFLTSTSVLCLGMTLERLTFNAELLEKCAKAYVLAQSSGMPIGKIPWLVRHIAGGRLKKDQRHAAMSYAQGRQPERSTAY